MGLFTRKKEVDLPEKAQVLAGRIAGGILSAQRRSAAWLNTRASKMGKNKTILIMAFLGLGFGLWCLYLVLSPLL